MSDVKVFSKILDIIAALAVAGVIILAVILFIPRLFGYTPYIVMSGSMEPYIETGSVVFVDTNEIIPEVGDVIAFRESNDVMVTHRVVAYDVNTNTYTTKGDANNSVDPNPVSPSQIVGTYKQNLSKLGYLLVLLEAKKVNIAGIEIPTGPVLIVFFLLILNMLAAIVGHIAEMEDEKEEEEWDETEIIDLDETENTDSDYYYDDEDNVEMQGMQARYNVIEDKDQQSDEQPDDEIDAEDDDEDDEELIRMMSSIKFDDSDSGFDDTAEDLVSNAFG